MTVMVLLRIFADLGFYYAFAATVSSALGGRFHFPALLLLAACYAACCRFREQKRRQRLVLALAALAVLLPAPWGARLAYIPAWGYVVYLVRRGDRDLSRARQVEFFEYFIRGFLFFAFFWCAVRFVLTPIEGMETGEMIYAATHDFLAAGVPMALFGSTATMLFLRSIRHEPAVYLQPGFQAVNAGIVAAALVFCALLTSPLTVRLAAWVYSHLLIPILLVLFMMVGMALALTAPLIQLLVDLARRTGAEDTIQVLMEKINEFSASFQELFGIPPAEILLRGGGSILAVLAMAAGIVLLRLFLRWLVQRWRGPRAGSPPASSPPRPRRPPGRRSGRVTTWSGCASSTGPSCACARSGGWSSPPPTPAQTSGGAPPGCWGRTFLWRRSARSTGGPGTRARPPGPTRPR